MFSEAQKLKAFFKPGLANGLKVVPLISLLTSCHFLSLNMKVHGCIHNNLKKKYFTYNLNFIN